MLPKCLLILSLDSEIELFPWLASSRQMVASSWYYSDLSFKTKSCRSFKQREWSFLYMVVSKMYYPEVIYCTKVYPI